MKAPSEERVTTYHDNGAVDYQGTFKAGSRHGLFHFWNDQGVWLKQELYVDATLLWASTNRDYVPPNKLLAQLTSASETEPTQPSFTSRASSLTAPESRFLNSLPGHGSFVQLSLGSGSEVPYSSAQRLGIRGSYADGRLGGSVALTVARFQDDYVTAWAKPVADLHASYLLPHTTGIFVARAGVVVPIGNDNNRSALAGASAVVQSPNEAIYVLPSTLATRGSLSWYGTSKYVVSQIDLGLDLGFFGYPDGVHPIVHANAAIGVGAKGFILAAEGATALAWTRSLNDVVLFGGALYGRVFDTTVGIFAGKSDETEVVRMRIAHDF